MPAPPRALVAGLALLSVACGGTAAGTEMTAGGDRADTAADTAATETPREEEVGARPADAEGVGTLGVGVAAGHVGHGGRTDRPEPVAGPVTREGRPVHDLRTAGLEAFVRELTSARGEALAGMVHAEHLAAIRRATRIGVGSTGEAAVPPLDLPAGCEVAFTEDGGYGIIAIPPAMNDQPESDAAAVDRGVRLLSEGLEVTAWCMYARTEGEEDASGEVVDRRVVGPGPVYILNVARVDGRWRVQAWGRLDGREAGVYPQ